MAFLGGAIGGLMGAGIWAAVACFTNAEIGWIAWVCGGLVGLGMRLFSRGRMPAGAAVVAVVITALAIVAGKYSAAAIWVEEKREQATGENLVLTDELVMAYIADEFVLILEAAGEPVEWPAGVDPETAQSQYDYPLDVWAATEQRWGGMSAAERDAYRAERRKEREQGIDADLAAARAARLRQSFGGMNLVFFALAVMTAAWMAKAAKVGHAAPDKA